MVEGLFGGLCQGDYEAGSVSGVRIGRTEYGYSPTLERFDLGIVVMDG